MNKSKYPAHTAIKNAVLLAGLLLSFGSYAASDESAGGMQGTLNVNGFLLESPCGLDMRSEFQIIEIKDPGITTLSKPGDTGTPLELIFRLPGCRAAHMKSTTGSIKSMVRFMSQADPDEPSLFRLNGATGVALRIMDSRGRQVLPGERKNPAFKNSAGNLLVYTVIPVRTKAKLTTGNFEATIDFGMLYE
ncbi:hypothetical protein I5445_08955 [Citrobacter farmeri]|uniref:fimbrial protein n=1 Tax=Citrobacter farmeri TaxID=67824 RepID=UPI001907D357|nr:fimbrial protein [Citrobacter farmeri]EKV7297786.1 hypothetical protein [Citrobacter farmeri]MBJ8747474.1 hypothetical protein [Citrobacter farmeri]MBJ8761632.1 hypothetical protein [Citrobacter farmeri]MBJ9018046.1 hypothetical protein [Citrobacter farmeri]